MLNQHTCVLFNHCTLSGNKLLLGSVGSNLLKFESKVELRVIDFESRVESRVIDFKSRADPSRVILS